MEFSQQIRMATAENHRSAESNPFITRFMRGQIKFDEFQRMQSRLYLIYCAMEDQFDRHQAHPLLSPLLFPELRRRAVLEKDLACLWGKDWQDHLDTTPECREYLERIQWVGNNDPTLLIAHKYTRYLGDLSGGQILAKIVRKALSLSGKEGTQFFEFDEIESIAAFKEEFRSRMDSLALDESTAAAIIDEAKRTFTLNAALFSELS